MTAKKKTEKIDAIAWMKKEVGMLPSSDYDVKLFCGKCNTMTLTVSLKADPNRPHFSCTKCRRHGLGFWQFLATFRDRIRTLADAKRFCDTSGIDYNNIPDDINAFPTDKIMNQQHKEMQQRDERRIERRQQDAGHDPIAAMQERIQALEAQVAAL